MKNKLFSLMGILAIMLVFGMAVAGCDKDASCDHAWEWRMTTNPTATASGIETETCRLCGETRGTRVVPAFGEPTPANPLIGIWYSSDYGDGLRFTATELFHTEDVRSPVWDLWGTYTVPAAGVLSIRYVGETNPVLVSFTITGSRLSVTWDPWESPEHFTKQ